VGRPVRDPVAEAAGDHAGVLGERLRGLARRPAPFVLEPLRQVEVVERDERPDAGGEQVVDQAVVEVQTGRVDAAVSCRDHARPRDREAEHVDRELSHERDVLARAVVEVARVPGGGETVPDAWAAPVLAGGPFDLVGRCRNAPLEVTHGVTVDLAKPLHRSSKYGNRFRSHTARRGRRAGVPSMHTHIE
jgi:hypothetical protein